MTSLALIDLGLTNLATGRPCPTLIDVVTQRVCVAIPYETRFGIVLSNLSMLGRRRGRCMIVLSVDGRNVIDNSAASKKGPGYVEESDKHECLGFRTSTSAVREFVHKPLGSHETVAERNGSVLCHGIIAAVVYNERPREAYLARAMPTHLEHTSRSFSDGPTRGARGGGAAAGREIESRVTSTSFEIEDVRASLVLEYATREDWAIRGIHFPLLNESDPWPGDAAPPQRFSTNL